MKPMPNLASARDALSALVYDHWPEMPGAETNINRLSRAVIRAIRRIHGEAHLYAPNGMPNGGEERGMHCVYRRGMARNFAGHFVLPGKSDELIQLMDARRTAPYTTTAADLERVEEIYNLADSLGAAWLIWS
jgi:hypothetical protein